MNQLVQFADEVADNEPLDEYGYVPFREAYPMGDRWKIVGVDRWSYASEELVFHGPVYFVERGSIYSPGWHVRKRVRDNYLVSTARFDEKADADEYLQWIEANG